MMTSNQDLKLSNLNDAIERILHSCASRETNKPSLLFGRPSAPSSRNKSAKNVKKNGGRLSQSELTQLSLFCTTMSHESAYGNKFNSTITPQSIPEKTPSTKDPNINQGQDYCDMPFGTHNGTSSVWATVEIDTLFSLTSSLEEHVTSAACIDIIADARRVFETGSGGKMSKCDQSLEDDCRSNQYDVLRQGLEAACILVFIMISPGIDRRIMNEDYICACIGLMRHHLYKNIIPALSSTANIFINSTPSSSNAGTRNTGSQPPRPKKRKIGTGKSGTKLDASPNEAKQQPALGKFMKKVRKTIHSSIGVLALLMERIDLLVQSIPVDDQPLLCICSAALSSLTICPFSSSSTHSATTSLTRVIQMASLTLITTVFRQYKRHRSVILEDLFPLFLKLPTARKSMRTFPVCETFFGMGKNRVQYSTSLPSLSNRKRSSAFTAGHQANIQVITALILFLVQSCVNMPCPDEKDHQEAEEKSSFLNLTSGHQECELVCEFITSQLVQRCSKKGEDGGASEFRPILFNLVEDLLNVQTVPEFPAAEMLLLSFCRRLSYDLVSNSSVGSGSSSTPPAEGTYLTTAMDMIGTICSDIASKIVSSRENALDFTRSIDVDLSDKNDPCSGNSKEVNGCFCGRTTLVDTFMLDCDRCHSWFHGTCVGVAKDNLPEVWICDECKMKMLVMEQAKIFTAETNQNNRNKDQIKAGDLTQGDQNHVMKILLLNFLSNQVKVQKSHNISTARKFHLAKFIEDAHEMRKSMKDCNTSKKETNKVFKFDADALFAYLMEMWNFSNDAHQSQKCEHLSEEGNVKLMFTLYASQSKLVASFPRLLGVVLTLMEDESTASLRKLAVKAVSQVVQVDLSLMSQPKVRSSVARRFQDEAISVREAAVTLVGTYVLQMPSLANAFHKPLLSRFSDNGISVRKRVIKIFRDLMCSNATYTGRADACTLMLQRAADSKEDDGIRDLIHETFNILWFDCSKKKGSDVKVSEALSRVRPCETAKQMVEVVKNSRSPEYLTTLVKELLFGFAEGDKSSKAAARKQRQIIAQNHCCSIVTSLIEQLIVFEEMRANQDTPEGASGPHLVALISTLGVFAEASPDLLLKDLDVLLPYLKADNGVKKESEALIVFFVCKILCRLSTVLSYADVQKLGDGALSDDLVKITYNFGSNATSAAVEALAKLASHEEDDDNKLKKKLVNLAGTFFSYLTKVKDITDDFSKTKPSVRSNVYRALSALGSICRFHEKEEKDDDSDFMKGIFDLVEPHCLTWENIPMASYALFDVYIRKVDTSTKCKALRAMSGIFLARPRVMLIVQQHGLLEETMSDTAPPELQLEALQCWQEILVSEEMRIESGEAKRQMESNDQISLSNQISGDQDSDASLIGACCIQHASRLFQMTSSMKPNIRLHSLLLVQTLLRQGLINPMDTVPHLLALQGDIEQPAIRAISLKLIIEENERRPDIIRQRLVAGVQRSFQFQRQMYPGRSYVTALVLRKCFDGNDLSECIFGQIFKDAIRNSRSHSTRILLSLLGLFTNTNKNSHNHASTPEGSHRQINSSDNSDSFLCKIPLLCFAAEIVAHLPYNHLADVLFIVHQISGSISVDGNEFMMRFADFLQPYGLTNEDGDLTEMDVIEKAASSKKPSTKKALKCMRNDDFDESKFANLCAEASALVLLLRLKLFLRQEYSGVTETRLREYLPNEKEKISDRGISAIVTNSMFNANIPSSFKTDSKSFDKDALIRQYAEFRRLMRGNDEFHSAEDTDDLSVANVEE